MRIFIAAAILLALAPLGLPLFAMTLLTEALILGLLAMSLDLMVGYTRLVSFGHAAAYGLGAYASGYLLLHTTLPLPFAVLAAGALAGVVAIGVAWVCTLAKGVSFSMLGAFLGYTAARLTGSFWAGLILGPVVAGGVGAAFELGLLRRLYRRLRRAGGDTTHTGAVRSARVRDQGWLLLSSADLSAGQLPVLPSAGRLAVRRGAAWHP